MALAHFSGIPILLTKEAKNYILEGLKEITTAFESVDISLNGQGKDIMFISGVPNLYKEEIVENGITYTVYKSDESGFVHTYYTLNNKLHRENEPAYFLIITDSNFIMEYAYFSNNKLHREDGPAISRIVNGPITKKSTMKNSYWYKDEFLTENQYNRVLRKTKLKKIFKSKLILLFFLSMNLYSQNIFVFGDSHTNGGLGLCIGLELRELNPKIKYHYYGINGAGFTNNFMNDKDYLVDMINYYNPNIIICILGANEVWYNQNNYYNLLISARKFFTSEFDKYKIIIVSSIYYPYPDCKIVSNGLKEFAKHRDYGYIDIFDKKYSVEQYKSDYYHFNINGYQILSKYIVEQLNQKYLK